LIAAGVGVATAGYELANQPSAPPPPTDNAAKDAAASSAASTAQAEALMKRRGLAATQLTSPMGVSGAATVGKATLG